MNEDESTDGICDHCKERIEVCECEITCQKCEDACRRKHTCVEEPDVCEYCDEPPDDCQCRKLNEP